MAVTMITGKGANKAVGVLLAVGDYAPQIGDQVEIRNGDVTGKVIGWDTDTDEVTITYGDDLTAVAPRELVKPVTAKGA